jgi:hypothetical protein
MENDCYFNQDISGSFQNLLNIFYLAFDPSQQQSCLDQYYYIWALSNEPIRFFEVFDLQLIRQF